MLMKVISLPADEHWQLEMYWNWPTSVFRDVAQMASRVRAVVGVLLRRCL